MGGVRVEVRRLGVVSCCILASGSSLGIRSSSEVGDQDWVSGWDVMFKFCGQSQDMREQIYIARVLPKFAPHIGCHTVNDIEDRIKSMLTKNQFKMFCTKSIFGFFMKKKDCVVQAQLGRCIMSLEIKESSTSAIVISAKGTILHFTPREFALVTVDTVSISRLHFDLVESDRYSDYPWRSVAFEELARSLHKKLKLKGRFYMFLGMPLAIQIWLYECCSSVSRNVASKVFFKNIEPTRKKISTFQIPKKLVPGGASHNGDDIDSDDDFQDPPQRQKQLTTKNQHHAESLASPAKQKLKPHPKGIWQEFNDIRGLISSRFDQMMNAINENKNPKSIDESIGEAQISESQYTFSDEVLRSIDLDFIKKVNVAVEDEFKNKKSVVEINVSKPAEDKLEVDDVDKSKLDHQHTTPVYIHKGVNDKSSVDPDLPNSQITLPDELLPNLNAYQIDVCLYYLRKKSKYDPNNSYKFSTVDCNFMNIVRRVFDVYKVDDASLNAGGKEYHLIEYISGFHMHATVSWHTVDHMFIPVHIKAKHHWVLTVISFSHRCIYVYDSLSAASHDVVVLIEIEKLAEVIPICLSACKFYENNGIDIDNHPNDKLNDKMNPFCISAVENLPQQPSGSLDCGLYMITYVECLTFGEGVPSVEFDPDLIHIRYASLLWDYGTRKKTAKAQSDDETSMRPLRKIELKKGTEVHDI
ncbi:hypothetical protein FXO38_10319 [Capsicum annuum]|nr:hypothetical protein FXO37_14245 [Capsicum annuum]KAF3664087.1 hypothetical protein FXO38_10319 [Capsicum annuum]